VRAVVAVDAPRLDYPDGTFVWRGPPLLMAHGDDDPLVPIATASTILGQAAMSAYLLTVFGGGHGGGLNADNPAHAEAMSTVVRFLDGYLNGSRSAVASLRAQKATPLTRLASNRGHRGS
jgi:fermentation-respiration switch protein FrsA (DUF1100 family)